MTLEDDHTVFSSEQLSEEHSPGSRQIFVHVFYGGKSPPNKVRRCKLMTKQNKKLNNYIFMVWARLARSFPPLPLGGSGRVHFGLRLWAGLIQKLL